MVNQDKKEFLINNQLIVKLEDGKTKIFVDGKEFLICKMVILDIPHEKLDSLTTMDEIVEESVKITEIEKYNINPITEFWVHCSNLQAWAENDYNPNLLETKLSFPLLKRLADAGDRKASKALNSEIIQRYVNGTYDTKEFLSYEGYLDYLTLEEIIIGGLEFNESNLLLDIIEYGKPLGIKYHLVITFDDDIVRHRLSNMDRFLTIYDAHVSDLEVDLNDLSFELFNGFHTFKGMRNLVLTVNLKKKMQRLSEIRIKSLLGLTIYNQSEIEWDSNFFSIFPNLIYLKIFSSNLFKLKNFISLKKLTRLEFNNCFTKETLKDLDILKKKGVEIINFK